MKKLLIITLSIIVIVCLGGVLVWNVLPAIVSHKLSKKAGVSVSMSNIRLYPSSIKVDDIRVGNPPKYTKTPRALSISQVQVNVPMTRFFNDRVVIDEMTMDDVYIGLEFDSPKSRNGNWTVIMNNLNQTTNQDKQKAQKKGNSQSVLIKKLIIKDLQIDLAYRTGNQATRQLAPIDRIELTNISSEGGIPTAQIMNIVMQETLKNIFSTQGLQNMLDGVLNPSDSGGMIDQLKGLF